MSSGRRRGGSGWLWILAFIFIFGGSGLGVALAALAGTIGVFGLAIAGIILLLKNAERKHPESNTYRKYEQNTRTQGTFEQPVIDLPDIDPADQAILTQARKDMTELRVLASRTRFSDIRTAGIEACAVIEKILTALRQQPDEIRQVQLFLQYSLPTARDMVRKYNQMEMSGVATGEVMYKVLAYLREVKNAGDKQLTGIFENEVADIDAELEVLRQSYEKMGI